MTLAGHEEAVGDHGGRTQVGRWTWREEGVGVCVCGRADRSGKGRPLIFCFAFGSSTQRHGRGDIARDGETWGLEQEMVESKSLCPQRRSVSSVFI